MGIKDKVNNLWPMAERVWVILWHVLVVKCGRLTVQCTVYTLHPLLFNVKNTFCIILFTVQGVQYIIHCKSRVFFCNYLTIHKRLGNFDANFDFLGSSRFDPSLHRLAEHIPFFHLSRHMVSVFIL